MHLNCMADLNFDGNGDTHTLNYHPASSSYSTCQKYRKSVHQLGHESRGHCGSWERIQYTYFEVVLIVDTSFWEYIKAHAGLHCLCRHELDDLQSFVLKHILSDEQVALNSAGVVHVTNGGMNCVCMILHSFWLVDKN